MKRRGFKHEPHYEGETNDWITPKWIVEAFGDGFFDLDPCASVSQPWPCAKASYTIKENGLIQPWAGNVYLNAPYGPHTKTWVRRLIEHQTGVALVFGRTDTALWQDDIFQTAAGYLFIRGRVRFHLPDGGLHPGGNAGAPSVLIAWGEKNYGALIELCDSGAIPGAFLPGALYTGSLRPNVMALQQIAKLW